jgi:hypothetical protein
MKRSVRYAINTATALVKILMTPNMIAMRVSGDTWVVLEEASKARL